VAAARALYDVVGLVTVAQAHRAADVLRDRVSTTPWTDDDDGWAEEADESTSGDAAQLEPLRR
jgi:hypothetical protein